MSNKRDQNWSTSAPGRYYYELWSGKAFVWRYNPIPVSVVAQEVRKLVRTPGKLPVIKVEKPYVNKHVVIAYPQGQFCHYSGGYCYWHKGQFGTLTFNKGPNMRMDAVIGSMTYIPSSGDWPVNPDLLSQAEVKAYAALRNKYQETDLSSYLTPGVWYGERRETAGLLRDAAVGLGKLVKSISRLSVGGVRRALTDFRVDLTSNQWKRIKREINIARKRAVRQNGEVLYGLTAKDTLFTANRVVLAANLGVAPLMRDLDAAYLGMLQRARDPSSLRIKANGWVNQHTIGTVRKSYYDGRATEENNVNSLLRYRVTLVASPADSDLAVIERAGLLNVPSTLGELTGCSFILNYFYPILDYLKAVSTPAAFTWVDGSWSVKISHLQNVRYRSLSPQGWVTAVGSYRHVEFRRKVYSTFPVPTPPLSFRGTDLTVDQAVNVTTVAIEKVRKALGL